MRNEQREIPEQWEKCKSCGHWEHECKSMEICEVESDGEAEEEQTSDNVG